MKLGRDERVGKWFWRLETPSRRWSVRLHFWLAAGNGCRLNRQPLFAEVTIARCAVLCHSRLGTYH